MHQGGRVRGETARSRVGHRERSLRPGGLMPRRIRDYASTLGRFVSRRLIPVPILADFSGCSPRYLYFMCHEPTANPSLKFVNRVTVACRLLTNEPVRA